MAAAATAVARKRVVMGTSLFAVVTSVCLFIAIALLRGDASVLGRAGELIGAALEGIVDRERPGIGKRQELHQDHAGDAAARVDPEIGVVDAAPAETAGRTLAARLVDGDQE